MRLGAVISTAGGLHNVFERAKMMGCDSLMLFTKNNRQWKARPISNAELVLWQETRTAHPDLWPIAGHCSYLINIASPKDELWEKSYRALKVEMERAILLDIPTLTFHPGSHTGSGEEAGLSRIATALSRLFEELPDGQTALCLETMAGQGSNLGHRFEQLAQVLETTRITDRGRLGVCFDLCHVFAAGYDLRSPKAYAATMAEFDATIGLDRLLCFHLNDSKHELGSRKDRHTHIGHGHIGLEGFANLLNDPRFIDHPAHLETPKFDKDDEGNEVDMDLINLEAVKSLVGETSSATDHGSEENG
jgi:deoxyribonuclease-4